VKFSYPDRKTIALSISDAAPFTETAIRTLIEKAERSQAWEVRVRLSNQHRSRRFLPIFFNWSELEDTTDYVTLRMAIGLRERDANNNIADSTCHPPRKASRRASGIPV
jgi:hypothetical protein